MALDQKLKIKEEESCCPEEERKVEKNLQFNEYKIVESFKKRRF